MLSHNVPANRSAPGKDVLTIAWSVVAAASFLWFLSDSFGRGWSQITTDFPNYYTAARLTTTHTPDELRECALVVPNFENLTIDALSRLT